MSARAFAIVMAALAIVGLLTFGLLQKGEGGIALGEPLPDTELAFLDPTTSTGASLSDYRGQWVLANVWASWCAPCRDEAPALESFWRKHRGEDFALVGIDTQDNSEDALAFVDEHGLTYEQLHDGSGDYADEIGTTGVPESVLIDPDGNVAVHIPRRGGCRDPADADRTGDRGQGVRRAFAWRGVLAVAAAGCALVAPAAGARQAEPPADLADISDEVMCVVCGVPLELATEAPQAQAEREFIRRLIDQGRTKEEVKDALVAEYGENVLAVPGTDGFDLAAWVVPGRRCWRRRSRSSSRCAPGGVTATRLLPAQAGRRTPGPRSASTPISRATTSSRRTKPWRRPRTRPPAPARRSRPPRPRSRLRVAPPARARLAPAPRRRTTGSHRSGVCGRRRASGTRTAAARPRRARSPAHPRRARVRPRRPGCRGPRHGAAGA